MNKNKKGQIQFLIGLVLALSSAAWTFLGSFQPSQTVILIIGIIFIASSKYRPMK